VAVSVWVPEPTAVGVYVTLHVPALNVHELAENEPVPPLLKLTVPVGVDDVPGDVSDTDATQVLAVPTTRDAGLQLTVTPVERFVHVVENVPLLARCEALPG
jgi:hypothetical protein